MRNTRLAAVSLAVATALALAACSSSTDAPGVESGGSTDAPGAESGDGGAFVIGSTTWSRSFEFYQDVEAGMTAAAGDLAQIDFRDPNGDLAEQTANIEDFIASGVDLVTLVPLDSDAAAAEGKAVVDAGIPLITIDIAITEDIGQVAHIASDNFFGGQLAARKMVELLGDSGEVLVINNPAITSISDRSDGFVEELAKIAPAIKIVATQSGDSKRETAQAVAENLLQAYPNATGMFAANETMALGALQAVNAAGRADLMNIIGFDASSEGLEAIKAGSAFKATVAQNPYLMGQMAIQTALKVLAGETVEKYIPVPVELVDETNYADYMK